MKKQIYIVCLQVILLLIQPVAIFGFDGGKELYKKGKKHVVERKWKEAIETFQELTDFYQDSKYVDDAYFWIGYSFEMVGGREVEAFSHFQRLTNLFPKSPWTDDAKIHQISLAGTFVQNGDDVYQYFLLDMLKSEDQNVRYQSALTLAQLRDKRALFVLEEMMNSGDEEIQLLAETAMEEIDRPIERSKRIELHKQGNKLAGENNVKLKFPMFEGERYKQYKTLRKKGNDWTTEELMSYGLWHIVSKNEFREYFALTNNYDKKEWIRKFWKRRDPTPTTEDNELKSEFERRVIYAQQHFSEPWDYSNLEYLKEQHIRTGSSWAPWDCRGEIYIKYGEPSWKEIEDLHVEIWEYYGYHVTFKIKKYMTNIYGNALEANGLNAYALHEQEIRFGYNYGGVKPIKDFEFDIQQGGSEKSGYIIKVNYKIHKKELKFRSKDGVRKGIFRRRYAILNSDFRTVKVEDADITVGPYSKEEFKKIKYIEDNFTFQMPKGEYTLALRIEDRNSKKMEIYTRNFDVKNKSASPIVDR